MSATVRPATYSDAYEMAPKLRVADTAEIRAASGSSPLAALLEGVRRSTSCYSCEDQNGVVFAMFGVAPHPHCQKVGIVWMLATDELRKHRKQFLRESRRYWGLLHNHFPVLWNLVDARNTEHVRWIKWSGGEFQGEKVHGKERRIFMEFIHRV